MDQLPNSQIKNLPDELLLEIFDLYREDVNHDLWMDEYVWLRLAHVCRKWRTVMFTSPSRLGLCIPVGPQKPDHIQKVLSGPFPILVHYKRTRGDISGSALWRLRALLKHPDRLRGITFEGTSTGFHKFFSLTTGCTLPVLESLELRPEPTATYALTLPDTFLKRPDSSDLHHLRRLKLYKASVPSICGFLSSTTALTHLCLETVDRFNHSLLVCLQDMLSLCSLHLSMPSVYLYLTAMTQPSTPHYTIALSKLTSLRFTGQSMHLNDFMAWFSAPFLQDVDVDFVDHFWVPNTRFSRFIDDIKEHYHTVRMSFTKLESGISLVSSSEPSDSPKPHFDLGLPPCRWKADTMMRMCTVLSTRLIKVTELCVTFDENAEHWKKSFDWRSFLQQFPSVKTLRAGGVDSNFVELTLLHYDHEEPDDVLAFLPALEEIELDKYKLSVRESKRASQLAVLQPFVSARQRAGRPVKVLYG